MTSQAPGLCETCAYFIALIDIHDPDGYQRYLDGFDAVFERFDGEVIAVDEAPTILEGRWPAARTVVIRFPSEDDLLDPAHGVSQLGNRTSARSSRRRLQASASSQP